MTEGERTAATQRGRRALEVLSAVGRRHGFEVAEEYPVVGGRVDLAWLSSSDLRLPGLDGPLVVAGFEIESSWRTRKHIKGDFLNLHDLGAAIGVIVLLGDGQEIVATRAFANRVVDRPGPRVLVWDEADLDRLARVTS